MYSNSVSKLEFVKAAYEATLPCLAAPNTHRAGIKGFAATGNSLLGNTCRRFTMFGFGWFLDKSMMVYK